MREEGFISRKRGKRGKEGNILREGRRKGTYPER